MDTKEAGIPKENPHEVFRQTMEISKQAMYALVDFSIQNGVPPQQFSHISRVFEEDGHVLLPPIENMRAALVKVHGPTDRAMRTRALTTRKTGQVFVPEEQADSVHDVLHESTHRAAWLKDRELGLSINTTNIAIQLASRFGVTITADGKVDPNSDYIKRMAQNEEERENLIQFFTETLKAETPKVTEAITEWVTQKANGVVTKEGKKIILAEEDMAYDDEVRYANEIRVRMMQQNGLTQETVDAKLITAALTGDINELIPHL